MRAREVELDVGCAVDVGGGEEGDYDLGREEEGEGGKGQVGGGGEAVEVGGL